MDQNMIPILWNAESNKALPWLPVDLQNFLIGRSSSQRWLDERIAEPVRSQSRIYWLPSAAVFRGDFKELDKQKKKKGWRAASLRPVGRAGKKNDPLIWNLKSVWRLQQSEVEQRLQRRRAAATCCDTLLLQGAIRVKDDRSSLSCGLHFLVRVFSRD